MTLKEWVNGGDGTGSVDIVSLQSSRIVRTFDYMSLNMSLRFVLRLRLAWVLIRVMFGAPS